MLNDSLDIVTSDKKDCWYSTGKADCDHHTEGVNWTDGDDPMSEW